MEEERKLGVFKEEYSKLGAQSFMTPVQLKICAVSLNLE